VNESQWDQDNTGLQRPRRVTSPGLAALRVGPFLSHRRRCHPGTVSGCAGRPDHPPQPGSEGGQTLSLCPVTAVTPSPRVSVRSTSWNRAPGPSQPPTPRPGPTTPSPTFPRSRSNAAPATAGSSTNTGEQHRSPGQVRKPSTGTLQDEQVAGGEPDHVWQAGER
jgi:hypothetical protein